MLLTTFALATALLALGYTGAAGVAAQRFTSARRQAPGPLSASSLRFPARDQGATIAATYLPTAGRRAAVVFVHGKDACRGDELKGDSRALAAQLNAAGLSVLMIDLRCHGDSSRARLTYGERERHDVLGAVDWLRAQGYGRIGVLGVSMGGASSLLAAADEPDIAALVTDSAFADFGQMIQRQFGRLSHLPGIVLPGALAIGRALTGVRLQQVRPLDAASRLAGRPCLMIHSAGDHLVPPDDAERLAAAAQAELWITDSRGHIGSYRAEPTQYTDRVVGFFCHHLASRPA